MDSGCNYSLIETIHDVLVLVEIGGLGLLEMVHLFGWVLSRVISGIDSALKNLLIHC